LSEDWAITGVFGEAGGTLRTKDFDVELRIPPRAVKDTVVTISAAVSADLEYAHDRLCDKLSSDQRIVSPVAEYSVDDRPAWRFEGLVTISLPHFVSIGHDSSCLQMFCVSRDDLGQVNLSKLPAGEPAEESDHAPGDATEDSEDASPHRADATWYWTLSPDGQRVVVYTDHFSGYLCTHCDKSCRKLSCAPQLFLRAK
jgi:hypothetical protein